MRFPVRIGLLALCAPLLVSACSDDGVLADVTDMAPPTSAFSGELVQSTVIVEVSDVPIWIPSQADTWQWQLEGELNTSYAVDVYDVDLFDTDVETIASLKADGSNVVCYFSAGSWEEWRGDAGEFDEPAIGETLDGWEDERWIDVRDPSVRRVMVSRLDLAVAKGCDGVEPDNVAGFDDDTGLDFTRSDQIEYNLWLASEAHSRSLSIALKNSLDLLPELVDSFDFAVNEECWEYDECDVLEPFLSAGKAVFNAEYAKRFVDDPDLICPSAVTAGIRTLVLPLDLDDSFRLSCDE